MLEPQRRSNWWCWPIVLAGLAAAITPYALKEYQLRRRFFEAPRPFVRDTLSVIEQTRIRHPRSGWVMLEAEQAHVERFLRAPEADWPVASDGAFTGRLCRNPSSRLGWDTELSAGFYRAELHVVPAEAGLGSAEARFGQVPVTLTWRANAREPLTATAEFTLASPVSAVTLEARGPAGLSVDRLVCTRLDPGALITKLEGEAGAHGFRGEPSIVAWAAINSDPYSGKQATYTASPGSELTWPVMLQPGRYRLSMRVWAYEKGGENSCVVQAQGPPLEFSWLPGSTGDLVDLAGELVVERETRELRLEARRVGQTALVIDALQLRAQDAAAIAPTSLEAEQALVAQPVAPDQFDWEPILSSSYSNQQARATTKPRATLTWTADLPAGTYELLFSGYAYNQGQPNQVSITVGSQKRSLSWPKGKRKGSVNVQQHTVELPGGPVPVSLSVDRVGQAYVIADFIGLRPVAGPGLASATVNSPWWAIPAALLVALAAVSLGTALLELLGWRPPTALSEALIAAGLGLTVLGTATTGLGIAGWFYRPVALTVLVLSVLAGARPGAALLGRWWRETGLRRPGFAVAAGGLALVMGWAALPALAPAAGVDPQIYHLAIPKWLQIEHAFTFHPYQIIWAYPHQVSNLFALAQSVYPDPYFRSAQVLHAILGVLWILSVYAAGRVLWGRSAGLAAAALCLAIEGVMVEMGMGLVDLGFAFLAGSALLVLVGLISAEGTDGWWRPVLAAAVIAGGAAACKMNGPALAVGLGIGVATWLVMRRGIWSAIAGFVIVGVVSLAVACPMYLKNYLVYGNPLYPFPTGFPNQLLDAQFCRDFVQGNTWDKYVLGRGAWAVALWPIHWVSKSFVDPLSPGPAWLLGGLVFLLRGPKAWKRELPLVATIAALMVTWFFISPLTRFAWPWLALMTLLACAPLSIRPLRPALFAVPVVLLLVSLPVAAGEGVTSFWALPNLAGEEPDDIYLERVLAAHADVHAPPLRAIQELNRRQAAGTLPGRTMIDTNLVAYADFQTVPFPYYLMERNIAGRHWAFIGGGPLCLAAAGKRAGDDELLAELVNRLGVGRILFKKGMPSPPRPLDGVYRSSTGTTKTLFTEPDRFDAFIKRWVTEGLVAREEMADGVLYTLTPAALARGQAGSRPAGSEPAEE